MLLRRHCFAKPIFCPHEHELRKDNTTFEWVHHPTTHVNDKTALLLTAEQKATPPTYHRSQPDHECTWTTLLYQEATHHQIQQRLALQHAKVAPPAGRWRRTMQQNRSYQPRLPKRVLDLLANTNLSSDPATTGSTGSWSSQNRTQRLFCCVVE